MFRDNDERKLLPAFQTLRAFEAVGRLSGIRRAAQDLQLDHAVVSRHLRTLEEWAGTPLIARQNGRSVLTDEGVRYHARISAALRGAFGCKRRSLAPKWFRATQHLVHSRLRLAVAHLQAERFPGALSRAAARTAIDRLQSRLHAIRSGRRYPLHPRKRTHLCDEHTRRRAAIRDRATAGRRSGESGRAALLRYVAYSGGPVECPAAA